MSAMFGVLADTVVVIHLAFVLFIVLGGFLVLRRRWVTWLHLPATAWGAGIEFSGAICPLTPLENWLRAQAGGEPYAGGFIEHCVVPTLYPATLTRGVQVCLAVFVLTVNAFMYWRVARRAR